jgi:hypothetical protein
VLRNLILLLVATFCLCGCPPAEKQASATRAKEVAPVPVDDPLAVYGKLKLGMNSLDIAQVYPAPEGKGEGFTRLIEDYDAVSNQIIQFDKQGKIEQRIVLRVFRDQLAKLVDRRDGLTAVEADEWLSELKGKYGDPQVIHPGVQWSWGDREGILLTYTRDNAFEDEMSANVVLEHNPSYDASVEYLRARETSTR